MSVEQVQMVFVFPSNPEDGLLTSGPREDHGVVGGKVENVKKLSRIT